MTEIVQLNTKLKAGNAEAYKKLFDTSYNSFYLYALKLCRDSQKAEDIVQESLTKLWANRNNIDPQKPINPYIYQIIKNTFLKYYKKKQTDLSLIERLRSEVIDQICPTSDEEDFKKNQLQLINDQIEKLPKKSKVIFNLNKKRGLRYKEIGELLNITEKTVESHIYRALQRIKSELK